MSAYYNERDKHAAAWLRELIRQGLIAPGDVDERDIQDVKPGDVRGYRQCHFFAGIGGWSYALRLAGWPDDQPVWTGSCPCQPFSAAGKRTGFADERHLWPAWFHLIRQCEPASVFGEQVASRDGLHWLALVQADLEGASYACGAADLCAAGLGAPHKRQRIFFMADAHGQRHDRLDTLLWPEATRRNARDFLDVARSGETRIAVVNARGPRLEERIGDGRIQRETLGALEREAAQRTGPAGGLADSDGGHAGTEWEQSGREHGLEQADSRVDWAYAEWINCRDGFARPTEPGTFPLVDGVPARLVRISGYGNAIVPQVAAAFIRSAVEARSETFGLKEAA